MFGLFRQRREGYQPMIAGRADPKAVCQLLDILNGVFSQTPDEPLQNSYVGATMDLRETSIAISWKGARDPDGKVRGVETVPLKGGSLEGTDAAERTAHAIRLGSRRVDILQAAGIRPGDEDPLWAFLMPQPHMALLQHMGITTTDFGSNSLAPRIAKAVEHRGGFARLGQDMHVVLGRIGMPADSAQYVHASTAPLEVEINTGTVPETALAALHGRPIDDLVMIGQGCPETIIMSAEMVQGSRMLRLGLSSPLVPLMKPPASVADAFEAWRHEIQNQMERLNA